MSKVLVNETSLTGIANAIRSKNGLSAVYKPSEMAGAIEAIQTGSSTPTEPVLGSEITFYDYDGTILYAYTRAQAQALSALPSAPAHNGLIFSGWTHTLEQIKATKTVLKVGATYKTDDGTTRIYIHLEDGRTSPMLGLGVNGTVSVDWGDGSTPNNTLTGTNVSAVKWTPSHNYAVAGDYVIKLTVSGSAQISGVSASNTYSCLLRYASTTDERNKVYQRAIRKVEIGNNISIGNFAFGFCSSMREIVIPNTVSTLGNHAFYNCQLSNVILPNSITSIGEYGFRDDTMLTNIVFAGIETVGVRAFYGCNSMSNFVFPSTVSSILDYAFYSCGGVKYYDFTACTSIPTLSSAPVFNGIPVDCEIRVPATLETRWKNATNWATYSEYIVGV